MSGARESLAWRPDDRTWAAPDVQALPPGAVFEADGSTRRPAWWVAIRTGFATGAGWHGEVAPYTSLLVA